MKTPKLADTLIRPFLDGPTSLVLCLSLFLVVLISVATYFVGPHLGLLLSYLVPIFLASWLGRELHGVAVSIASIAAWGLVEIAASNKYSRWHIPAWDLSVELFFFLVLAVSFAVMRRAFEREKEHARVDYNTGAYNKRHFVEVAGAEILRSRRYNHPFSVAYMDLDNFKAVNDRFGHQAGDQLLRLTVESMRANTRDTDTIARLGGDEFVILFPETGYQEALLVMERIQASLAGVMQERDWPVTLSAGVITYIVAPASVDEMINKADELMYEAKRSGKNAIKSEIAFRKPGMETVDPPWPSKR